MSYSEEELINISIIKEFFFCPRITYWQQILPYKAKQPEWVQFGKTIHTNIEKKMNRRSLRYFRLEEAILYQDFHMSSSLLGIVGIADCIMETQTKIYPIEYKNSPHISIHHIMQLIGYGLLAKEHFGKLLQGGFILLGKKGKPHRIEINNSLIKKFWDTVEEIRRILENNIMPPSSSTTSTQCATCHFLSLCNDR